MLVYEYLPHELARLGVVSKAAGLDHRQVAEHVSFARERESSAREAPPEPHHLSERFIASLQRLQWERIAHLMEERRMAVYVPSRDPRAVRYEEQRLQRLVEEVDRAERAGVGVPEVLRHRVYRISAQPAGGRSAAGVSVLTIHLMAASPEDAAVKAWAIHGRHGGLYQRGDYRITSVERILPEPGELF
ncbi:hypothetical protein [Streptomyces sp. NPDC054834]